MQVDLNKNNMTPEQFVYWLQGYSEIEDDLPSEKQWGMIQDHLKTVFEKQTPDYTVTSTDTTIPFPTYIHPIDRGGTGDPLPPPHNTVIC